MNAWAVFGLSILLCLIASVLVAVIYLWPPLRAMPRDRALRALAAPHVFRFIGLGFLVPGVVSPSLPRAFAAPAAYGDLVAVLLALVAVIALTRRWSAAVVVVWLFNLWGTADFLYAFYEGAAHIQPGMLGATFFIPTALVPPLLVAHFLAFRLLVSTARP